MTSVFLIRVDPTEALSTPRIRIFLNRPHFLSRFRFSPASTRSKNIRIHCRIRQMHVDGSCIQKEKVADSKISGYVWTGPGIKSLFRSLSRGFCGGIMWLLEVSKKSPRGGGSFWNWFMHVLCIYVQYVRYQDWHRNTSPIEIIWLDWVKSKKIREKGRKRNNLAKYTVLLERHRQSN